MKARFPIRLLRLHAITLVWTLFGLATVSAQDIHFSHIHASPTFLNPAMTGLFDGDYRVAANYKQQWRNTTANYRTIALALDGKVADLGNSGFLGLGVNLFADRAGDLDFTATSAMVTVSGARILNRDRNHFITLAIRAGVLHNSLDYTQMHVFDPEPTVAAGAPSGTHGWDASAGVGWFKALARDGLIYLGLSGFHLNMPDLALIGQDAGYREELARRWVFHGGSELRLRDRIYLMPSFMVAEQSPHREINTGTFVRYDWQTYVKGKGSSVFFGGWFRYFVRTDITSSSDALVLAARFDKDRVSYAFSYDVNLSTLTRATHGAGGPELSIIYRGDWNRDRSPKHNIDCPVNF